jgi:hypothetical protein
MAAAITEMMGMLFSPDSFFSALTDSPLSPILGITPLMAVTALVLGAPGRNRGNTAFSIVGRVLSVAALVAFWFAVGLIGGFSN